MQRMGRSSRRWATAASGAWPSTAPPRCCWTRPACQRRSRCASCRGCLAPPPLTAWRCSRWGLCPHWFTFIRDNTSIDWQDCKM